MTVLRIQCGNLQADEETIKAQKQWVTDRTVSVEYLKHTLGDISKGVSVSATSEPPKSHIKQEPK